MLRLVFTGPVHTLTFQELSFHFIEEIGEVSEALADATTSECLSESELNDERLEAERRRKFRAIAEELADVWSWSASIVAKVQQHFVTFEQYLEGRHDMAELEAIRRVLKGSQHLSIAEIIWQQYGLKYGELRCHDCHQRSCQCAQQRAQPLYREAFRALSEERRGAFLAATRKAFGGV
jgi:NTP pyrophosphatase (non-canonical NTP hydrolase)